MTRSLKPFVPLIILAGTACGGDGSSAASGSGVRDSAAVRVVENVRPAWQPGDEWRLADEPRVTIGGVQGDSTQQLFRLGDGIRLSNGNIVIANVGTYELRFYDRHGDYIRAVGGQGGGPGEFKYITWVRRWDGDSIVAYDRTQQRLTYFDRRGERGRIVSVRARSDLAHFEVVGVFSDGSLLAMAPAVQNDRQLPTGVYRRVYRLFRVAVDGGSSADSLGWAQGYQVVSHRFGSGRFLSGVAHFSRDTWYLVRGNQYYVATNDTYEIKVYSSTGDLQSVIRKQHVNLPVTDEIIADVRERAERSFTRLPEEQRPTLRRLYELNPFPTTMPAYGAGALRTSIHLDQLGNLWVREYNPPGEERIRWTVFDTSGLLLGTLEVPDGLEILDIRDDYVLGKWKDELDVEYVRLYELIKPSP